MSTKLRYNLRRKLKIWYNNLPGKVLGEFRILPLFFVAGAVVEFTMIHWHVGEVNFYDTYKRKRIEEAVEARLHEIRTQSV